MYRPGPTTKELEAIGLKAEDVVDTSVQEVWAENWDAFSIFFRMGTQWRVGMNGSTGLDYSAITAPGGLFDLCSTPKHKRLSVLDDLRLMESEALTQMRPKHE